MDKKWIVSGLACLLVLCTSCKIPDVYLPDAPEDTQQAGIEEQRPPVLNMPKTNAPQEENPPEPAESEPEPAADAPQTTPEPREGPQTLTAFQTAPVVEESMLPGDYNGLELPVRGATGYTSVSLAMWRVIDDYNTTQGEIATWEQQEAEAAAQRKKEEEEARRLAEQSSQAVPEQPEAPEQQPEAPLPDAAPLAAARTADPVMLLTEEIINPPPPQDNNAVSEPPASGDTTAPVGEAPTEPAEETPAAPSGESSTEPVSNAPAEAGTDTMSDSAAAPAEPQTEEPASFEPPSAEPVEAAPPEPEPESKPAEPRPSDTKRALAVLPAGTPFTILEETDGGWWQIQCTTDYIENGETLRGEVIGWVQHRSCMINLPDVIPSIIYDAVNGYSSRFVSCGKQLDGITGKALYTGAVKNNRLNRKEFMMPVLYAMAPKLCAAQRAALAQGNSLILYEGYRPLDTQLSVSDALRTLMNQDAEVKAAVTGAPWNISWFIATGASNHQHGYAVDVSLARIVAAEKRQTGSCQYLHIGDYDLYQMPTVIHELSRAAATFTTPVGSNSTTAWKSAALAPSMNESAIQLQRYCTNAGLSPLASEWWHFNDLAARSSVLGDLGRGGFEIRVCRSTAP